MQAAPYHRVSTTDQDPTMARHELRAAANARGYEIAMEVEETGSGARNDRPGLQQVMVAARKRQIDAVLVWKLDRFGRSTIDVPSNIRQLVDAGVRFETITQGISIDPKRFDPTANFTLAILAATAELPPGLPHETLHRCGLFLASLRSPLRQSDAKSKIRRWSSERVCSGAAAVCSMRRSLPLRPFALRGSNHHARGVVPASPRLCA